VSPYADIVLELLWLAAAAAAVWVLARRLGCGPSTALFVGFGAAPLIVTGAFYYAGYTHLPGVALSLLVLAAAVSGRPARAGTLLGLLVFVKLTMVPIAVVLLAAVFLSRRSTRGLARLLVSLVISAAAVVVLLALRGELGPYLGSLALNLSYSQGSLVSGSTGGPFVGHLARVMTASALEVVVVVLAVLSWVYVAARTRAEADAGGTQALLWSATLASLVAGLVVLGLTGLWDHHAQVLYVPAVLAVVLVARRRTIRSAASVLGLTVLAVLLSGANLGVYATSAHDARGALAALGAVPDEAAGLLSLADSGTYARVGQNDDGGHAFGLRRWTLACPRFHQYPFDSAATLGEVAACLPTADYIIVSASAAPVPGRQAWNDYLAEVDRLLDAGYDCAPRGTVRICVRSR
jgi:hypothetical protein